MYVRHVVHGMTLASRYLKPYVAATVDVLGNHSGHTYASPAS